MKSIAKRLYASLRWYDFVETRPATDALWRALADSLRLQGLYDVPAALDREGMHGLDAEGRCLFTRTCGYLLFHSARDHFTVLGAPCYGVPGCDGPLHRSYIVVREHARARRPEDLRGARFAVNEPGSNSGMNLPRLLFARLAEMDSPPALVNALRDGLRAFVAEPSYAALREDLFIDGVDFCDEDAYGLGYATLA